eukprot:CAMPEP_0185203802 /NCGR_PEP_ID=MMETSP1140-20130426/53684_1 /TAXON_ID=298111 /ORGANISM="Pavlova sp., Strain CCMP459" /LENGTH=40 /DNA_ID= /DNA_START= /DNA_END= /DNA_ORIENTATION=
MTQADQLRASGRLVSRASTIQRPAIHAATTHFSHACRSDA